MGNLNCCNSQPNQTDIGLDKPEVQNFTGVSTANPDHGKVQAQVDEGEEVQQQSQIKEQNKSQSQNTYIPDRSIAEGIKKRISHFQPAVNACLKQIEELIFLVAQIYDPSEQVITLKQVILTIGNNLSNLNLYWIAVHEKTQETPAFLESLEKELQQLKLFFNTLKSQASQQIQQATTTEDKSEHSIFKELLQTPENVAKLQKDVQDLQVKRNQFQEFTSVRGFFENKFAATQGGIQIQNAEQELTSYLPAYIRKEYSGKVGFALWNQLFKSSVDVCVATFAKLYADKCGLEATQIQFIVKMINSGMNTISFFEFMHFIQDNENSTFFDNQGLILKNKQEEVAKLAEKEQEKVEPKQESTDRHVYQNGAVYEGKLVDGLREGDGKFQQFDIHYEGGFKNGLYSGEGTQTFPDETKYSGSFSNGFYHGQGELTTYNGIVYSGEWFDGELKKGTITFTNGLTYKGDILYNRFRTGKGQLVNDVKQVIFDGDFVFDELANGTFKLNNEVLLEGEFNQNKITKGTLFYRNAKYVGELNSVTLTREGEGVMTWDAKQQLSGKWVNDAPTVAKNVFDINSDKKSYYEGQWSNFNRHGTGKFVYQSGAEYDGEVNMNIRSGNGTYTFANKNVYKGQWANNDFNGKGIFTFANKDVYEGDFKNGKFDGFGVYKYSSGKSYKGEWKEDKWNGQGVYFDQQNKPTKQGNWESDQFKSQAEVDLVALEQKYQQVQAPVQQQQQVQAPVQQQQVQAPVQQQQVQAPAQQQNPEASEQTLVKQQQNVQQQEQQPQQQTQAQ